MSLLVPLLLLSACSPAGVADPRPALAPHLVDRGAEGIDPHEALRTEQVAAACTGFLARLRAGSVQDSDWVGLVTAASRMDGCLAPADGDALIAWALDVEGPPERGELWRGAAAEWKASRGDAEGASGLLAAPGHDASRLRVALRRREAAQARDAAEGALIAEPREALACRVVATESLAEGDVLGALEAARCGGNPAPLLGRVRADALARAELWEAAVDAYRAVGANVHAAVILSQELPGRRAEARELLAGPGPADAVHRGWLDLLEGRTPVLSGLPLAPPAMHLRALAQPLEASADVLQVLERAGHARAKVALAQVRASRGDVSGTIAALGEAVALDPASEPVHRSRVALLSRLPGAPKEARAEALAAWASQDPEHVRLRGEDDDREVPWVALAPWTWTEACGASPDPRCRADAPSGRDAVGEAWRAASVVPTASARLEALAALHRAHPELYGLAAARWRIAAPDPTRPLDVAPTAE